jgi:hypothetical protein
LLIAAGARGLLAVPADFAPGHKTATQLLLEQPGLIVMDVRVQGDLVLVLVERPHTPDTIVSDLVILDPVTLNEVARHRLGTAALYDRFVD